MSHRLINISLAPEAQTVMKLVHIYMKGGRICITIIQVKCSHVRENNVQVDSQAWP